MSFELVDLILGISFKVCVIAFAWLLYKRVQWIEDSFKRVVDLHLKTLCEMQKVTNEVLGLSEKKSTKLTVVYPPSDED